MRFHQSLTVARDCSSEAYPVNWLLGVASDMLCAKLHRVVFFLLRRYKSLTGFLIFISTKKKKKLPFVSLNLLSYMWLEVTVRSVLDFSHCIFPCSVIGTSSLRRAAQLKKKFPHLEFRDIVSFPGKPWELGKAANSKVQLCVKSRFEADLCHLTSKNKLLPQRLFSTTIF